MRFTPAFLIAAALWAQDTGSVEGTVINSVTGVGISGATVYLYFGKDHYETVTDGAGTFQFSGIRPGDYVAHAEKSLFTPPPPTSLPPPRVPVGSSKDAVRLRFELLPPGTLRGRVFGIDGKPSAHAKVDLGAGIVVTANEDGSFVFENVEPRSYTLTARPPAANASFMQDGARTEILPTYFPSVLDANSAQQIRVQPGSDQSGLDIQLRAAPVYRVRGVVLDPDEQPAAKAVVEVLAKAIGAATRGFVSVPFGPFAIFGGGPANSYALIDPAVTKADGSFEFPSIPVGDWTLRAESDAVDVPGAQHQIQFHGSGDIRLGRTDVDDVRIQLLPVFDLGFSIESADSSPAPENGGLPVSLDPVDGGVAVLTQVRGNRFENLQAGTYRISDRMMLDGPYYAAHVLVGDTDVTGQPVQLSPSSPPIRIILGPAATLRGVVDKGEGAAVILWRQTTMPGDFGRSIPCGAGGVFEMRGLPPGDYYVIAVERYGAREMTTAAYLQGMIPRATRVRLEEGATVSLDLNLTR